MATNTSQQKPFDLLPPDIQDWISSELIASEIGKIIERLKTPPQKEHILALLIGRVIIKKLPANQFVTELAKQLAISIPTAQAVGIEVKNNVLKPIAGSLWKHLQIDVADLTKAPVQATAPIAQEIKMERPISPPPVAPSAKPAFKIPVQNSQTPRATVTEFTRVTDIKKPLPSMPAGAQPAPQQARPNISAPPRPFGLAEVQPVAPKVQETQEHADLHPMVEKSEG